MKFTNYLLVGSLSCFSFGLIPVDKAQSGPYRPPQTSTPVDPTPPTNPTPVKPPAVVAPVKPPVIVKHPKPKRPKHKRTVIVKHNNHSKHYRKLNRHGLKNRQIKRGYGRVRCVKQKRYCAC